MATYLEIFLRPLQERSIESVVDELSSKVGTPLSWSPDIYEGQAYVGLLNGRVAIELFADENDTETENLPGMPYSEHPHMLVFRKINTTLEAAQKVMEDVYDKLRVSGHYSLFATFDSQYLLKSDTVRIEVPPGTDL